MVSIFLKCFSTFLMLIWVLPAHGQFRVPDTQFDAGLEEAESYPTRSLLGKFNIKLNELAIGPYTGTWQNRKSSRRGGFLMRNNRKTSTAITLESEQHGVWAMFCSGELKGFDFGGISFDSENEFDYQCVMEQDADRVIMRVLPYKKPKFYVGQPQEDRQVEISNNDGLIMEGESIHALEGTRRTTTKPAGYHIWKDDELIGGTGRRDKNQLILANAPTDSENHIVFMVGLGLHFFTQNDLSRK